MKAKVAIVGCGRVGSTIAYSLMLDDVTSQIVLIDKDVKRGRGEALDLSHGIQFSSAAKVEFSESYEAVSDAQVVVIAAGVAQKPGQSRDELIATNVGVFADIVPSIVRYNKKCIILVVTNPLDVMTYVTWKLSGLPRCQVMGTGTVLDSARLRYLMAIKAKVSAKDICVHVLGEHGDRSFAWCSKASIAGISLDQFPELSCEFMQKAQAEVRKAAYQVIDLKGATFFSIAMVTAKLIMAIVLDQSRIFTVSTILENYQGLDDSHQGQPGVITGPGASPLAISVPTIVRASGVCKNLEVDLDDRERVQFSASVTAVRAGIDQAMTILKKRNT